MITTPSRPTRAGAGRALRLAAAAVLVPTFLIVPLRGQADPGAPGPEHARLGVLVGSWDVIVSFPVGPGRLVEGQASCEARWVLDGRFLRLEYSSILGGRPLTIVRYVGYDRARDSVVEIQFESTHTDVLHAQGTLSADGRTLVTEGRHRDVLAGRIVPVRSITTIEGPDAFTLVMTYGRGTGDGGRRIALTHRRRGP